MSDDRWLEKVRKMLTLAENPAATPAEAEAFTARAAELMAKYGIEQAMVDALKGKGERQVPGNRRITCAAPYASEKVALLNRLGLAMGCQCVQTRDRLPGGGLVLHMFGFEADMQRAELLYTSLLLQQITAMRFAETMGDVRGGIKAWRRSFLNGYAHAVGNRVDAIEAEARNAHEAGTDRTALVVADRKVQVGAAVAGEYPRLHTQRRSLTGYGHRSGRAAGEAADIGGRAVGGHGRAIGA